MSDKGLEITVTCPCCADAFDTVCFGRHTTDKEEAVIEAARKWYAKTDYAKPGTHAFALERAIEALDKAEVE